MKITELKFVGLMFYHDRSKYPYKIAIRGSDGTVVDYIPAVVGGGDEIGGYLLVGCLLAVIVVLYLVGVKAIDDWLWIVHY